MKGKRRYLWALLAVMCMITALGGTTAQAKNMKSTKGIMWNLKVNKLLIYKSFWPGVGMITQNVKMTRFSETWSSTRAGYRVAKFRLTFIRKKKPTARQLANAASAYALRYPDISDTSPGCYYAVVDFKTGKSLEVSNPYGVIVSDSGWKKSAATTYRTDGYSIQMRNMYVDVQIEYPYKYKNLCIGVGGYNSMTEKAVDKRFWRGKAPFWNTKRYRSTKYKRISHFGRLWFDP